MFCPETIRHDSAYLWVCHYGRGDVSWKYRPRSERWNPLRYEIGIRTNRKRPPRFWINRKGHLAGRWSNFVYRLRNRKIKP